MQIDFDINIEPFYQALITKVYGELTASKFYNVIQEIFSKKNNHSDSHILEFLQPKKSDEIVEDNFLASIIKHSKVPTWYKSENKIDLSLSASAIPLDIEYDLLVFYKVKDYLFVHTNCEYLFAIVQASFEMLFKNDGIRFTKLTGDQLSLILSQREIEYRSLGIQNHFGMGGTAPDAKTYFAKDTSRCLTPSFDSGFGFSYCLGSMQINKDRSLPFGCSKKKSKIWTTWVSDLNEFCEQCNSIVKWLEGKKKNNNKLDVLVQSTSKKIIPSLNLLEFFLDYYILEKGVVFLGRDTFTLQWQCKYDPDLEIITFDINDNDKSYSVEVCLSFNLKTESYDFSYKNDKETLNIRFSESESDLANTRSRDLVAFLNKQEHFTLLFDGPYAYRDSECWEDNRLKKPFIKISNEINWKGVDIRKEDSKAAKGKINILQKVDDYFKKQKGIVFCSNDNGANEIADYIVLTNRKLILIHAKYASNDIPGLNVGDIQIVASQTVKNIRFFVPNWYDDKICDRLHKNCTRKNLSIKNGKNLRDQIIKALQNKDLEKECWIVQPGISIPKLIKDKKNKIHTILNFIDSILKVNNVNFVLIANPK